MLDLDFFEERYRSTKVRVTTEYPSSPVLRVRSNSPSTPMSLSGPQFARNGTELTFRAE